jgi:hypothetical protein
MQTACTNITNSWQITATRGTFVHEVQVRHVTTAKPSQALLPQWQVAQFVGVWLALCAL